MIRMAGLFFGYLFSFLIARIYGASVLGEFVIAYIIIDLAGIFISFGLETRMVVLVSKFSSQGRYILSLFLVKKTYLIVLAAGFIMISLLYSLHSEIEFLIPVSPTAKQFAGIMIIAIIPLALLRINAQYARGLKQIRRFAVYNYIFDYLPAIIFLMILSHFFHNKGIIAVSYTAAAVLACMVSIIPNLRSTKLDMISEDERKELRTARLLKDSYPLMLSELMHFIKQWSGLILIAVYLNESSVGVFSMAFKLSSVPGLIQTAVNNMALPLYGENIGRNNLYEIPRLLKRTFKLLCLTAVPVTLCIIFSGYTILNAIGSEFTAGYIVLIILLIGQILEILSGSASSLILTAEKQHIYNYITMADTIILLLFSILLLPLIGMAGVAVAIVLSSGLRTILQMYYIKYKMNLAIEKETKTDVL